MIEIQTPKLNLILSLFWLAALLIGSYLFVKILNDIRLFEGGLGLIAMAIILVVFILLPLVIALISRIYVATLPRFKACVSKERMVPGGAPNITWYIPQRGTNQGKLEKLELYLQIITNTKGMERKKQHQEERYLLDTVEHPIQEAKVEAKVQLPSGIKPIQKSDVAEVEWYFRAVAHYKGGKQFMVHEQIIPDKKKKAEDE